MAGWVTSTFGDFNSNLASFSLSRKRSRQPKQFVKPTIKKQFSTELWVDIYDPVSRDDLAVHKKKIQEVADWITESFQLKVGRKILLLTGPAGCGKSATLRVLSKEMGFNIREWINPTTQTNERFTSHVDAFEDKFVPGDTVPVTSQSTQFREFLTRATRYASVCSSTTGHRLVLVEDLPNVILRNPHELHSLLRRHNICGSCGIIFIISDSTNNLCSVNHLFPADLQKKLNITNIVFNPIAARQMLKALERVCSELPSVKYSSAKEALQSLAEASCGDVRSAINALQFATCTGSENSQMNQLFRCPNATIVSSNSRSLKQIGSKSKSSPFKHRPDENLASVGGKDTSLFIFRALGKILYCKRDTETPVSEHLPPHLQEHERHRLQESPEEILDRSAISAESLSMFLHQNYLPFFNNIEGLTRVAESFSDGDILSSQWMGREIMHKYAGSVTARGVMHPYRGNMTSSAAWRPLTKPQWFTVVKESQKSVALLRQYFRLNSLSLEELVTVMVPYVSKIQTTGGDILIKQQLVQELATFSGNSRLISSGTITERDVEGIDDFDEQFQLPLSNMDDKLGQSTGTFVTELSDPAEDFCIEDYDE